MNPTITTLWDAIREAPRPTVSAELEADVDMELLDTTARDGIQAYVLTGSIDSITDGRLRACLQQLHEIVPLMTGEAAEYFGALRDIAEFIVGKRARPGMAQGLMG